MSCDTANTFRGPSNETSVIKKEVEIKVKPEPNECIVCVNRGLESYDVYTTGTTASGTKLLDILYRLTNVRLVDSENCPKYVCKSCLDLINVLEQAEIEYNKLKQTFEDIISKNPLFVLQSQSVEFSQIKNEILEDNVFEISFKDVDSEDEPLSARRKQSKSEKRKKKASETSKRKTRDKDCWDCQACGIRGATGGKLAETAHKLALHLLEEDSINQQVKMEDTDRSQSPLTENNDFDSIDTAIKLAMSEIDDDESSNYMPMLEERRPKMKLKRSLKNKRRKNTIPKVLHQCDQCQAKYTSLLRLQSHKEKKHDDSKPPYICEMCGAKYKHKRACDIHVAMHKGISDWKCEECNKLFPSKGALQRHNNIHTGKLNYQCDMCGKSFIHLSSFKMHKLAHSGVKPHSCDVCGLALMTRSHLKRHKRVHSGEKRHECAVCGKRFSERYNLAAHARSHAAPPDAPAPAPAPAPRRRMFRCAFCAERFERRYMLERHCGAAHGRALERPPPTPRNTMSKLLKAQAQARRDRGPAPDAELDIKDCSPKVEGTTSTPQKTTTSISAGGPGGGPWPGAPYAAPQFAPRPLYPH